MAKKRALTAYEDLNMYGGAHVTNYDVAKRAAEDGRDLIVHRRQYDGQNYRFSTYRVEHLALSGDDVIGWISGSEETWIATKNLCEFARTGKMF